MKLISKLAVLLTIGLAIGWMAGCATPAAPAPPLAPCYTSQSDQTMGEILAGAHAFYTSIQQQSAAGQMTLSATEKQAFNVFAVSLNTAQTAYLTYHAQPTAANLATAQAAVNQVQQQQAALPTPKVN